MPMIRQAASASAALCLLLALAGCSATPSAPATGAPASTDAPGTASSAVASGGTPQPVPSSPAQTPTPTVPAPAFDLSLPDAELCAALIGKDASYYAPGANPPFVLTAQRDGERGAELFGPGPGVRTVVCSYGKPNTGNVVEHGYAVLDDAAARESVLATLLALPGASSTESDGRTVVSAPRYDAEAARVTSRWSVGEADVVYGLNDAIWNEIVDL